VVANQEQLRAVFAQLRAASISSVRWWVFPDAPWQIVRDESGGPDHLQDSVYTDFDAALQLADEYDLYFDFVLFSAPSALPAGWLGDEVQREHLVQTLAPLFRRYSGNPHVFSWEIFNEPDWDVWNQRVSKDATQATVRSIAQAVHANSTSYATIDAAGVDGLTHWTGLGLDFYESTWYDGMSSGWSCARCTDYGRIRGHFYLDGPLVIGEFYAGSDVDALERFDDWERKGFAGAYAWSLLADHTFDKMSVDMDAARRFASLHQADLVPHFGRT
jgi:hypothetical protein